MRQRKRNAADFGKGLQANCFTQPTPCRASLARQAPSGLSLFPIHFSSAFNNAASPTNFDPPRRPVGSLFLKGRLAPIAAPGHMMRKSGSIKMDHGEKPMATRNTSKVSLIFFRAQCPSAPEVGVDPECHDRRQVRNAGCPASGAGSDPPSLLRLLEVGDIAPDPLQWSHPKPLQPDVGPQCQRTEHGECQKRQIDP